MPAFLSCGCLPFLPWWESTPQTPIFCHNHNILKSFLFWIIAATALCCVWKYTASQWSPPNDYNDKKMCLGATLFWHKVIYFYLIGYFLFNHIFKAFCSVCDFQIHSKPLAVINKLEIAARYFKKHETRILTTSRMLLTLTKAWDTVLFLRK